LFSLDFDSKSTKTKSLSVMFLSKIVFINLKVVPSNYLFFAQERSALVQLELNSCTFRPDLRQSDRTFTSNATGADVPLPRGFEKSANRLREGFDRREAVKSGQITERGDLTRIAVLQNLKDKKSSNPSANTVSVAGERLYKQAMELQEKLEKRKQEVWKSQLWKYNSLIFFMESNPTEVSGGVVIKRRARLRTLIYILTATAFGKLGLKSKSQCTISTD
jgi:hypothetical protein